MMQCDNNITCYVVSLHLAPCTSLPYEQDNIQYSTSHVDDISDNPQNSSANIESASTYAHSLSLIPFGDA